MCGYARLGGWQVGIVANQHHPEKTDKVGLQFGGVLYHESADKASRFIMDCNQTGRFWVGLTCGSITLGPIF